MPNYCYLKADFRCPYCATVVADMAWFQWGYSPGRLPREGYVYTVGDPIRWRYYEDGGLFSWAYFRDGEARDGGANIGDPTVRDLVVLDTDQFYRAGPERRWPCGGCGRPVEGIAVEIRDNYIRRAWVYQPGEFDQEADAYLVREGGMVPMPEWAEHPMASVRLASRHRLVVPYLSDGHLSVA